MRVEWNVLTCLHLDPGYALLSVQNTLTCMEVFNMMDIHRSNKINDVQFFLLLKNVTNLNRYDIDEIFNLLDVDHSGEIEFDEFYLLFCILIANKDQYEKEFIYRHSATIFQLIDADASGQISSQEFSRMGVLFNFDSSAIKRIFDEFDISGDKNLDFAEFRLFTMACIDEARAQETREKVKAFELYRERLLAALEPVLRRFVRTDRLPRPREMEDIVNHVRHPFIPGKKDFRRHFKYGVIRENFVETRKEIRNYFKNILEKIPCLFCCIGYLMCCYCCIEDPMIHFSDGKSCRMCQCKCRCLPCWGSFIRKLWTCCNCMFPCCHCCQVQQQNDYHIARQRKIRWAESLDRQEQEKLAQIRMEEEKKSLRSRSSKFKKVNISSGKTSVQNEIETSGSEVIVPSSKIPAQLESDVFVNKGIVQEESTSSTRKATVPEKALTSGVKTPSTKTSTQEKLETSMSKSIVPQQSESTTTKPIVPKETESSESNPNIPTTKFSTQKEKDQSVTSKANIPLKKVPTQKETESSASKASTQSKKIVGPKEKK